MMSDFFIYAVLIFIILYVAVVLFFYLTEKYNPKVFDDIINCKWDRD